jgi:hypothetical protein
MTRLLIAALTITVALAIPAIAQSSIEKSRKFTAAAGAIGTQNEATSDVSMTAGNWDDSFLEPPPDHTHTQFTRQNDYQKITDNLLTVTSMPERGTFVAPGNFALRQTHWRSLPVTNLDSFVAQSGMDFNIYGDEGIWGPPPLNGFEFENTIEQGIENSQDNATLTTGHRAPLPSAWLWTTQP